jgi:NADPH:quinone reductase-like Zn-dependent oxidoreductase
VGVTCWCNGKAVSVNPVDIKLRMRKQGTEALLVILGWEAAGIVEAVGCDCGLFIQLLPAS